jgi:oligopeptide transport system ATP-binding protein
MSGRHPHEFSGGQCQRIGIARAMILSPKLLICDEPVSSLDVSIQGQIVNLLSDMQRETGAALLFISHNLAVVRHLSHRILVMYAGRLVEIAPREELFASSRHPYSRALLSAVDSAAKPGALTDARLAQAVEEGGVGCAYRNRCALAVALCGAVPPLEEVAAGHWVACHRSRDFAA